MLEFILLALNRSLQVENHIERAVHHRGDGGCLGDRGRLQKGGRVDLDELESVLVVYHKIAAEKLELSHRLVHLVLASQNGVGEDALHLVVQVVHVLLVLALGVPELVLKLLHGPVRVLLDGLEVLVVLLDVVVGEVDYFVLQGELGLLFEIERVVLQRSAHVAVVHQKDKWFG